MGDATRDRFARQVAIALRVAGGTDIEYDADGFCLRYTKHGTDGWVANLANLYDKCAGEKPDEVTALVKQFVRVGMEATQPPDTWEDVADRLRPVLNAARVADHGKRSGLLAREFQPFVVEMVVIDHPEMMQYVNDEQPARWGVAEAQVFDRARANLAGNCYWAPDDPTPRDRDVILHMPESGNEYWVSHLLLDGWLAGWHAQVGGRPVLFSTDRTSGITIVVDRPDMIETMLEKTEEAYLEAGKPLSPVAYTVDAEGRVVPYEVPRGDPLWNAVHRSQTLLALKEYEAYKEEHEDDLDVDNYAGYVGAYNFGTRDDGSVYSVSVWGEGVDTLLPKTDFVAIINEARAIFTVPFDTLVRTIGLTPYPDIYPPRYQTPPWLTEEQLRSLRAAAVEP